MVAFFRVMYTENPTHTWLTFVIIFSIFATLYQLYWDFVKDWGFFQPKSRNYLLRDDLILKHQSVYYVSMVIYNIEKNFIYISSSGTNNYKAFIFNPYNCKRYIVTEIHARFWFLVGNCLYLTLLSRIINV